MTAPSLLYHFPSKEALFEEVLRAAWRSVGDEITPILEQDLGADEMLTAVLATLAEVVGRSASVFAQINATLLSGSGIGSEAVNDTLLPIIRGVESAVRSRAADTLPPDAPIRQVLLYVVLAHTAHTQLAQLAPGEAQLLREVEPRFALALLRESFATPPAT